MTVLTREELGIVHHYILLTLARQALEVDLIQLEKAALKLQTPYVELTKFALDRISRELATLKKYMASRQMKIEKRQNDGLFTEYFYRCRGYEGMSRMLNVRLKNQVHDYVTACFKALSRPS